MPLAILAITNGIRIFGDLSLPLTNGVSMNYIGIAIDSSGWLILVAVVFF